MGGNTTSHASRCGCNCGGAAREAAADKRPRAEGQKKRRATHIYIHYRSWRRVRVCSQHIRVSVFPDDLKSREEYSFAETSDSTTRHRDEQDSTAGESVEVACVMTELERMRIEQQQKVIIHSRWWKKVAHMPFESSSSNLPWRNERGKRPNVPWKRPKDIYVEDQIEVL